MSDFEPHVADGVDLDRGGAIELEAMTQALLMKSDDFAEFYRAWSDGRKPEWSGR
jgi:hypothetical protein